MHQLTLGLGSDPIAMLSGYLGGSPAMLDEAVRSFLCSGRIQFPIDVPERALTEAAAAIWTAEELAELRQLQRALQDARGDDAAWIAAWRTESLCRARLIRRVSLRWAAYWEGGWR